MISMTSDQDYYLYPEPMDMRKGISEYERLHSGRHYTSYYQVPA